jgi:hypothetical protein
MLTRFAPAARRAVIRAGMLASDGGRDRLSDGFFLLALAEGQPPASPWTWASPPPRSAP